MSEDTEPEVKPDLIDGYWEFDLSGQQINKKVAYKQHGHGSNPPDVGLSIGLSDDGSVAGVDVYVPGGTLTVTAWKDPAKVTDAFHRNCMLEAGKYNSVVWYGYYPGEMLFIGVRIVNKGDDLIELEYKFLIQPNESAADLPHPVDMWVPSKTIEVVRDDGIDGKLGWEFMWSLEGESKTDTSGKSVIRCKGIYIADVNKQSDFSILGLTGLTGLPEEPE